MSPPWWWIPYFGEDMDYEQRLENYLSENIKDICDQCGVTPDQDYFSFSDKQLLDAYNIMTEVAESEKSE